MKAIEFKTIIKDNRIQIPAKFQSEIETDKNKDVRGIVLIDDYEIYDDLIFRETTKEQFVNGYADSDFVYDNS
jgi:hypothetical protein